MTASNDPTPPAIDLDAEECELIRSLIMADPELVLSDDMVMRALCCQATTKSPLAFTAISGVI